MVRNASHNLGKTINSDTTVSKPERRKRGAGLEFSLADTCPELELIICCLKVRRSAETDERIKTLLDSEIKWDDFIAVAAQHAVIPLVYNVLSNFSRQIPALALLRLKNINQVNVINNLYLTNELLKLVELMEANGIRSLPYKGPVAAEFIYGDLSLRQFGDLDILIAKKDILKTKKLFHSIGYLPKTIRTEEEDQAFIDSGQPYNYKFFSANGKVCIELHWMFTSKFNSFPVNYDRIMDNLTAVKIGDQSVPSLKPEDLLLIFCQHGSKHFWERLLWICDIANLIQNHPNINWEYVIDSSKKLGAKRMLFLGLNLAQGLLDVTLPNGISKQISADRKVFKLSQRVIEQLFFNPEKTIHGFESQLFSFQMRERLRDKARYSMYHFIPRFITRKF